MHVQRVADFATWRASARTLLAEGAQPSWVRFEEAAAQRSLFDGTAAPPIALCPAPAIRTPKAFIELAKTVALHSSVSRYDLLYRLLWRLVHDEPRLLDDALDDDVLAVRRMEKAVHRDAHKAKAFVRFHQVAADGPRDAFVAWHGADHKILAIVAPFFSRRFPSMDWTVWTPHESAAWDGERLRYGPGAGREMAPAEDELIGLWQRYYAATFNPARKNRRAMVREMPVRYWQSMPETRLLPELLADADGRAKEMVDRGQRLAVTAADFLPAKRSLDALRVAAAGCRGCELCEIGKQTVFGEGPRRARLVLVGEQPGDEEDRTGRPFVGPAGRVLDAAMAEAGVNREDVYLTNTVKHFNHIEQGKQRLHKKPSARQANACLPWVLAELDAIEPVAVVALGATAAQTLIRRDIKITESRGQWLTMQGGWRVLVANHPSAVLRARNAEHREELRRGLVADLRAAAEAAF